MGITRDFGLALLALLVVASVVHGADDDGLFRVARLKYGGGGDWYANPSSLPNLQRALGELTRTPAASREDAVAPSDDRIFSYPLVYMTGHGNVRFTDAERDRLRAYLDAGGFLWADDNYGLDESFRREVASLYPDSSLVQVPFDHPIYHAVYDFPTGLPKIHEHDGGPPKGLGLFRGGRMVVFYSFNTDIGDGLEDPDVHHDPPALREAALRMAINVVVFVLSN